MSYCIHSTRSTPWSGVFLWKLTVPQLVKKLPTFYRTHRFITMFTSIHHLTLSRAWSIHSTSLPPFYFLKINFNIILPFALTSSRWSVSLRFPYHSPVCTSLFLKTNHYTKPSIIRIVKSQISTLYCLMAVILSLMVMVEFYMVFAVINLH